MGFLFFFLAWLGLVWRILQLLLGITIFLSLLSGIFSSTRYLSIVHDKGNHKMRFFFHFCWVEEGDKRKRVGIEFYVDEDLRVLELS